MPDLLHAPPTGGKPIAPPSPHVPLTLVLYTAMTSPLPADWSYNTILPKTIPLNSQRFQPYTLVTASRLFRPPHTTSAKNTMSTRPSKQQAAREVIDILHEISTLLNTHLDRTTLSLCVSLVENGVHPDALAAVIKELRRESGQLNMGQLEET
ncbi:unnamed protein product [Tuber melanosporum]|uniref:Mitotic-spindle organizing protein 1 n=1 Tax=Tuber melanosporum (strain Mel28) TaxID=656061 RepID=D5GG31_TUBMM|nr:uncharacterized protein GSTUM_00001971001 [Tuber melanosporum]CAZ83474.1 unnamed protein product [Tuber melanosporum]